RFLTGYKEKIRVHLMLETGMNRLGIAEHEIGKLLGLLDSSTTMEVAGIMSHLAAAPNPEEDSYTHHQAKLFKQMASCIEQHLRVSTTKHILNSAGVMRFPAYHFDMIRLGIGLYGVGMPDSINQYLEVASTLKTVVSQIKYISKGATIGYDRRGIAHEDMKIATIAIGYADGFRRAMGNGRGSVVVNNCLAPVVGNVCMDMAMVDVTHIPVAVGDEVVIFGKDRPIAEVAEVLDTIVYEVLTSVSERITRIYYTG
ncbi:MAG: alanine racemase, partial [Bacteroidota bacterium]